MNAKNVIRQMIERTFKDILLRKNEGVGNKTSSQFIFCSYTDSLSNRDASSVIHEGDDYLKVSNKKLSSIQT